MLPFKTERSQTNKYSVYTKVKTSLTYYQQYIYIQGVSRLVDITAGGNFLGFCDQKKFK